jgi:hypothetical protein
VRFGFKDGRYASDFSILPEKNNDGEAYINLKIICNVNMVKHK